MSAAHVKTQILDDQHTLCAVMDFLFLFCMMQGTQKEYPIVVLPFYTKKQKTKRQETLSAKMIDQ